MHPVILVQQQHVRAIRVIMNGGFGHGCYRSAHLDEAGLGETTSAQVIPHWQSDARARQAGLIVHTCAQQPDPAIQLCAVRQRHRHRIVDRQRAHRRFGHFGIQFDEIVARDGEHHLPGRGCVARPGGTLQHAASNGRANRHALLPGEQVVELGAGDFHASRRGPVGIAALLDRFLRQHAAIIQPDDASRFRPGLVRLRLLLRQGGARLCDLRFQQRVVQHGQYLPCANVGIFLHQHAGNAEARQFRRDRNFFPRDQATGGGKAAVEGLFLHLRHGHRGRRRRDLLFRVSAGGKHLQCCQRGYGKGKKRLVRHGLSLGEVHEMGRVG